MAPETPRIEPLEGKRGERSIRLIVARTPDCDQTIAKTVACDEISLIDLAETEEVLFGRLEREEFDCLIADLTFAGRNIFELRQMVEQRIAVPPATIVVTEAPDQKTTLKAMLVAKAAGGGYHVPHTVSFTVETVGDRQAGDKQAEEELAAQTECEANRRIEHRERVPRRGRIILGDGFSTIDCVIRDISAHGARFTVREGIAEARTLSLSILDTGRTHRAIRRWQRGPSIGVEFTGDAAGQQDDKAA